MRIRSARRFTVAEETPPEAGASATLGRMLIEAGEISEAKAERIAARQQASGMSFGQTAIALGYVSQEVIDRALARQFDFSVADRGGRLDPSLILARGGKDAKSEAIRSLRARLSLDLAGKFDAGPLAMTMVGCGEEHGRAALTANLAIAFAQSGIRTLLVDGNLRTPSLHALFGFTNQAGLSTFLARRQSTAPLLPVTEIRQLALLPAGPVPPNPQELLARTSGMMPALCEAWDARVVLFDAPSIDACDDAYSIAAAAPAVLMLARRNFTSVRRLAESARQFAAAEAEIIGAILDVA